MNNTRRLLDIIARLRHPDTGCPWDLQQDFASLVPYTIEEAHEVADAAGRGDMDDLREELGDLLFVMANLARHLQLDAETCLREGNAKFTRRFRHIEQRVAETGSPMTEHPLAALDTWWDEAKRLEKAASARTEG